MEILVFKPNADTLLEKYTPKTVNDIIGSQRQVYALGMWLKNFKKNAIEKHKTAIMNKDRKIRKRKAKKKEDECLASDDNVIYTNDDNVIEEDGVGDSEIVFAKDDKAKKNPNDCACALITGDHGTGKTAVVRAVLTHMGYEIRYINLTKTSRIGEDKDFVMDMLTTVNTISDTYSVRKKRYAVMVDEVHSIMTPTEQNIIEGLLVKNNELWECPVIFIGSNKHTTTMTTLKKSCYRVSMYPPTDENLYFILERIGVGEGIKFASEYVADRIIGASQHDYRRLVVLIGELVRTFPKIITNKDIDEYLDVIGIKDQDKTIYDSALELFTKYDGATPALKLYGIEKTNIPLMVQQNHFSVLLNYAKNKKDILDISQQITESISISDVLENHVYSNQLWLLQETSGFHSCVNPSYLITSSVDVDKLTYDSQNPYYVPKFSTQYPKDLNRTSTMKINLKKNIKPASRFFKSMTIDDYIMTVKLIFELTDSGRTVELQKIMKEYNLTLPGYMYVLKMDKINGTKNEIPSSVVKEIKKIAIVPNEEVSIKKKIISK
jgi:Cdc6-like AAA superfamily ATPase